MGCQFMTANYCNGLSSDLALSCKGELITLPALSTG